MRYLVCVFLVFACVACKKGGYNQDQMAKLTAPEQKIVGKYNLHSEFNSGGGTGESKELKDLMEVLMALEGGEATLECFPDKTYVMLVGDVPVKGDWNLDQSFVRLRILKVGDMKPEEISKVELKNMGISGFSMGAAQREEFLAAYQNSMALQRAESMAYMRVSADGTLYAAGDPKASIFGSMISYFKREEAK